MRRLFRILEKGFTILSLFLFSDGVLELVLSGGADEFTISYDGALLRLVFALVHFISLCLLVLRWKKVLAVVRSNGLMLAVIVFTGASVLWSDSAALTLRRVIALLGTSFFGLYLASRYTFKEQLRLLGWVLGLIIVSSLLFVVVLPHLGIATGNHAGAWRGIFAHKNGLGDRMALGGFTFLVLALEAKRYRWVLWCALGASIALLVLAKSTGALLSLVAPLAAFPIYRALRWRSLILVPFALLVFGCVVFPATWMWFNLDTVLIALGKDPSLTGRTEIWTLTLDSIGRQPWLGYGYQAFWQGLEGSSAYVWRATGLEGFLVPHAHNGILQLLLDIGIGGVVIFMLGFWQCVIKSAYWIRHSHSSLFYWPLLYLTYTVITNVSEPRLLEYNALSCVLYFSMAFTLGQPLERETTSGENGVNVTRTGLSTQTDDTWQAS